jgi:hypothetical protein
MKKVHKKEYLNNITPINKINQYTNISAGRVKGDTEAHLIRMIC